jgi:hypothetical protein
MLVLEPIFEADFPSEIYAYRAGRTGTDRQILPVLIGEHCRSAAAKSADPSI